MSFKLGLKGIQEILVLALMLVLVALLYSQIDLTYKISMAVLVFSVILLTTMATEALKQAEEKQRLRSK
ncbi:MAG TPA: hypothetical protein VF893_00195 [Candidatus Bathyarchaeia archaeon]